MKIVSKTTVKQKKKKAKFSHPPELLSSSALSNKKIKLLGNKNVLKRQTNFRKQITVLRINNNSKPKFPNYKTQRLRNAPLPKCRKIPKTKTMQHERK